MAGTEKVELIQQGRLVTYADGKRTVRKATDADKARVAKAAEAAAKARAKAKTSTERAKAADEAGDAA